MTTIPTLFLEQVAAKPHATAVYVRECGRYRSLTWHEVHLDVRRFVANLVRLGVQQGDRVVQFSENRYEWILADLAMHMLGAIHVPVHSTLSGAQVVEQTVDSGAGALLVSKDELVQKLAASSTPLPSSIRVFTYEDVKTPFRGESIPPFAQAGNDQVAIQIERTSADRVQPDTYATILYTSGTTGEPKGVVLDQRNLVSNSVSTSEKIAQRESDLRLNFLPLSHIFARTCDLYSWLVAGSQLALAASRDTVVQDSQSVRPTVINAVPYFYARVQKVLANQGREGEQHAVKNLLGGRLRFCCSGGAPLTLPLYDYFKSQGLPLLQGYGLTESSPVISVSSLNVDRRGAVGKVLRDVEVKIAEDGEVLTRGPHVMVGYWQNEEATREAIRDGWLYTGDLGRIDEDGYLYITGRKKEVIITATGKNVAPAYLEALLVEDPLIAQAYVVGDNRKFLTALIVPEPAGLQQSLSVTELPQQLNVAPIQSLFREHIAARLSEVANNEKVVKFTILSRPFSLDAGEITAKLSLRRNVIAKNFASEIEAMYDD